MNDRELIELAAKAAGIQGEYVTDYGSGNYYYNGNVDGILHEVPHTFGQMYVWNPLTDDGDALRLAVKLGIHTMHSKRYVKCGRKIVDDGPAVESKGDDPYAATRRAIVRVAAEIGRKME